MEVSIQSKRAIALLAAPAVALALAACGGSGSDVATTSPPAASAEAASPDETQPTAEPSRAPAEVATPARPAVEQLTADVAIANAEANIDNLAPAQDQVNVLDLEVLAVGDGSIQTLRDVVVGDRPVLLWFYAPH